MRGLFVLMPLWCLTLSFSFAQTFSHYDSLRGSLSPLRDCFDVTHYALNLEVLPDSQSINGYNAITYTVTRAHNRIQLDLFQNMLLDSIIWKDKRLAFERDSHHFFVDFPETLALGTSQQVSVFYHGKPKVALHPPWDGGWVWSKDSLNRPWIGVACEGIGASLWWPLKDHLSDEPDSMDVHYTLPADLICKGNGQLKGTQLLPGNRQRWHWKVSYPINSYNVTFNAGRYHHWHDTHMQLNGKELRLDYYVLDYHHKKAEAHFMQVKPMLELYEKRFGPYPFAKDGFSMVETPYWGMEHQGAIAYGSRFQNDVMNAWDYIIIHESAHEWWGNLVSTKDHGALWIHESFATYSEYLLLEEYQGKTIADSFIVQQARKRIKNISPIIGPMGVNYDGWEGYDMYYKGAMALNTLRHIWRNDSVFFDRLRYLCDHFGYKTIRSEDVFAAFAVQDMPDLKSFWQLYFYDTNIPNLRWNWTRKGKHVTITYQWEKDPGFTLAIPIEAGIGLEYFIYPSAKKETLSYKSTMKKRAPKMLWSSYSPCLITIEEVKP